jgi:hypothetical protein
MNSAYGGLRPWICPSFLASSGHETCDVLFKYASDARPVESRLWRVRVAEFNRAGPCGCQVERTSISRSLRSAQSRKRVPSFTFSRHRYINYPG